MSYKLMLIQQIRDEFEAIRKRLDEIWFARPEKALVGKRVVTREARADFTKRDVGYPVVATDMTHVLLINDKGDIVKLKHEEVCV